MTILLRALNFGSSSRFSPILDSKQQLYVEVINSAIFLNFKSHAFFSRILTQIISGVRIQFKVVNERKCKLNGITATSYEPRVKDLQPSTSNSNQ